MGDPSIEAPATDDIKGELKTLLLKVADKKEEDLTEAELKELDAGVNSIADLTAGLRDLALPGVELISAEIDIVKKKVNDLQLFCEKLEAYQLEYSKKVALGLIEILDVIQGTKAISPTWRSNLRKQAGLE